MPASMLLRLISFAACRRLRQHAYNTTEETYHQSYIKRQRQEHHIWFALARFRHH